MHVRTYPQWQSGSNSSCSSVLLLLCVRVKLLAAACCTAVPVYKCLLYVHECGLLLLTALPLILRVPLYDD